MRAKELERIRGMAICVCSPVKEEEIQEHFSATTIEDAANVTINGSDMGPV